MAIEVRHSKNGTRRYFVRVFDALGRRLPSRSFDRQVDAERCERQLRLEVDGGRNAADEAAKAMSFEQYFLLWHRECRSEISEGWRNDQLRIAQDFIFPLISDVRLRDIAPLHIGRIIERVRSLGKAEQTIMHVYNTLHKAFEDAIHHYEFLDTNPVRRRYRPKVTYKMRTFLKPAQAMRLLQHVRQDRLGSAIWLSLLSGLRPSEVMALRFGAVDFERRVIIIKAAYKRKVKRIEPYPKQADWGRAVMPPDLVKYLDEHRRAREPDDFVAGETSAEMLSYHVFYKGLRQHCKVLGLPIVTPHELRHSSTELLVEAGATAEDVRRQLNHASLASTRTYMHRTDDRLRHLTDGIVVPSGDGGPIRGLRLVR